jgi:hypothetical protein
MKVGGEQALERGGKKIPTPYDEAKAGLYRLPTGQLFVASDAVREAGNLASADIRDPSRKGRASMTKRFSSSVFLSTEYFPLFRADGAELGAPITDADSDWEVHIKRVVVMRNGIMRGRGLVRDWACDVEFEYDPTTIDVKSIAAIINQAGKYPGLLDYRPGKKGPMGRFQVVKVFTPDGAVPYDAFMKP